MYLSLNGIKKFYGEGENRIEVLKGINCEIEKGEICVLLGPSGSGKSTLLNLIGGIEKFDDGVISINGEALRDMNEKRVSLYRRKNLGYVFQSYNLIQNLTVFEENKESIEEKIFERIKTGLWKVHCHFSFYYFDDCSCFWFFGG